MVSQLELEPISEDRSAPPGPPASGDGEDFIGGFADSAAPGGDGGRCGGVAADAAESVDELRGVGALLG